MFLIGAGKPVPPAAQGLWTPKEVQQFSDRFFSQAMAKWHVPGAAFAVVKNGKAIFTQGYGYANLCAGPRDALFRRSSSAATGPQGQAHNAPSRLSLSDGAADGNCNLSPG